MIELPLLSPTRVHGDCAVFASAEKPLRPSRLGSFLKCPMSVLLSHWFEEEEGGKAADTGNLVHAAAAEYHRTEGSPAARLGVGLDALAAAVGKFPAGDAERARTIFRSYANDPANQNAVVRWVEHQVRLELPPAPIDPTGQPVVVIGTLDQVREDEDGNLTVHDIKTGSGKDANETVAEYLIQQAAYVMAARETLHPDILPGNIIYTPGYDKPRGRRHLPLGITIPQCQTLLTGIPWLVGMIRRGVPVFQPSAQACDFCRVKPAKNCLSAYHGEFVR